MGGDKVEGQKVGERGQRQAKSALAGAGSSRRRVFYPGRVNMLYGDAKSLCIKSI